MPNVPDPCPELRNRIQKFQTDPAFQKEVGENPTALVEGLTYDNANLIVKLIGLVGFHQRGGGGGNASFHFPPWPGGMPW